MEPRHERMLEATRRNVTRLKLLIDDLLALSKAEGRASDMEPVDLALLIREVVTDVRITAARRVDPDRGRDPRRRRTRCSPTGRCCTAPS